MTIAQQIATMAGGYAAKLNEADRLAVDRDQDWENESTLFTFADGSKARGSAVAVDVEEAE